MSYSEKFNLAKNAILMYCIEQLHNNWYQMFDMWIGMEADFSFSSAYETIFKEHFGESMNSNLESFLWLSGKNLVYAIKAFLTYNTDATLDDIILFTKSFITEQFYDFDNWGADDIDMIDYEMGDTNEENPSENV